MLLGCNLRYGAWYLFGCECKCIAVAQTYGQLVRLGGGGAYADAQTAAGCPPPNPPNPPPPIPDLPFFCFVEGTVLYTDNGFVKIEDLKSGDLVLSKKQPSTEMSVSCISRAFSGWTNRLVHIQVNNEEISCTPEHPFWVRGLGWKKAADLREDDVLVDFEGHNVVIDSMCIDELDKPIKIYNITVEEDHTYFVGWSKVLVHNKFLY